MSKSTQLMGLPLKNPILVAAGPWARDGASLQRCIDAGAAAVITETLTLEAHRNICPRIYLEGQSMLNTKLYSDLQLEQWEAEMEQLQKRTASSSSASGPPPPRSWPIWPPGRNGWERTPWRSAFPPLWAPETNGCAPAQKIVIPSSKLLYRRRTSRSW